MTDSEHGSNAHASAQRSRKKPVNGGLSVEILAKQVAKTIKKINSSKNLDGVKKQREVLLEKLDLLFVSLEKRETVRYEHLARFQEILLDIDKELPYIDKHIDRMDKSNAIKRAFIKKNVSKKFKEIAERISNISRTINVFEVNEKANVAIVEQEIREVQLQMDKLADNIKENNEKRDLDKVIMQPSRLRRERSMVGAEKLGAVNEVKDNEVAAQTKSSKSEQLLIDAHWYFYGEGTKKNVEKAIDLYEESARLGNINACMALGNFYECNVDGQVNHDMAAYYYRIAADLKKPFALFKIGQFIERGVHQYSTEEEAKESMLKIYQSAMDLGSVDATIRLAQIYEKGEHNIKIDKEKALRIYEEAPNDDEALNSIGSLLYERGQFKRAAEYFRKASEKGNITSLNNLGIWYELGKGVHIDLNKAAELYEEASKQDNAQAMSNLGYLLYKKGKVSNSEHQFLIAAHWFRKSISSDYSIRDTHYYLGAMHQNGDGVEQWYKSAFKFYKVAADLGHDIACERLGDLCYSGYGCIRPDKTKSFQWYTLGADHGNTQCLNNMGLMIEDGFDAFTPDPIRAAEFYQKAHYNNNTDATFNLGLLYLNTPDFETTSEDALELIQKAAMSGNKRAQEHLINIGFINNKAEFINTKQNKEEVLESDNEIEEEESENERKTF